MKVGDVRRTSPWWGRDGTAHFVADLQTGRTACGITLRTRDKKNPYTRFTLDTGEPWPKCKRCETAETKGGGG